MLKPSLEVTVYDVLGRGFMGLFFGVVATFGWRALHWPLMLFSVGSLVGCLGVFAGSKGNYRRVG
jgi:hypothetical protein